MDALLTRKDWLFEPDLGPAFVGTQVAVTKRGVLAGYGCNLGLNVGDEVSAVQNRRSALCQLMGSPLVWMDQVHGTTVYRVDPEGKDAHRDWAQPENSPQADGAVTVSSAVSLVVLTADCLPVVFVGRNARGKAVVVGVAHAGWRGLQAGILEACLVEMRQSVSVPIQIHAWLGPAIGPQSFEVGADVRSAFAEKDPNALLAFDVLPQSGKWMADLYHLARLFLLNHGVRTVQGLGVDTMTDSQWFSYRRSQKEGIVSGRMATVVRLLPSLISSSDVYD